MHLGYCTNVHAGSDLDTTKKNLAEHAIQVKDKFSSDAPMGIGLWLSNSTTRDLLQGDQLDRFRDWLQTSGLVPFTLNGFPYGDFHQKVVKHHVYQPTWSEPDRLEYTALLLACQDALLPEGLSGSLSTLPLGWGTRSDDEDFLVYCGEYLSSIAEVMDRMESETGRRLQVCIEPEPGCVIDTAPDMVRFFEKYLLTGTETENQRILRYLGVCHDICHSAVMRESQSSAVRAYDESGIRIGKVQVSAAIEFTLDPEDQETYRPIVEELAGFAEDRYLHQTTVKSDSDNDYEFFEDLPAAMSARLDSPGRSEWRIHFHVPIYRQQLGYIGSTQKEIREFLVALADSDQSVDHFEVETYAWNVLPPDHQVQCLADGISQELAWFQELYSSSSGR